VLILSTLVLKCQKLDQGWCVCFVSLNLILKNFSGREGIYRIEDPSSGTDDIEASEFFKRSIEGGL